MEHLEQIVTVGAKFGIGFFELTALGVMVVGGVLSLLQCLKRKGHVVLFLTRFMNFSLMFMLCGEILRMLFVRTFQEIGVVLCIVLLHGIISFLIHWEVKQEMGHGREKEPEEINL